VANAAVPGYLLSSAYRGRDRCGWRRDPLLIALAARIGDAKIVLGVLEEIFRSNPVAADCRFPGEGNVTLKYLIGAAADFEVGAIAVEGLISLRRSLLRWK
jgi:hypothetical protein